MVHFNRSPTLLSIFLLCFCCEVTRLPCNRRYQALPALPCLALSHCVLQKIHVSEHDFTDLFRVSAGATATNVQCWMHVPLQKYKAPTVGRCSAVQTVNRCTEFDRQIPQDLPVHFEFVPASVSLLQPAMINTQAALRYWNRDLAPFSPMLTPHIHKRLETEAC